MAGVFCPSGRTAPAFPTFDPLGLTDLAVDFRPEAADVAVSDFRPGCRKRHLFGLCLGANFCGADDGRGGSSRFEPEAVYAGCFCSPLRSRLCGRPRPADFRRPSPTPRPAAPVAPVDPMAARSVDPDFQSLPTFCFVSQALCAGFFGLAMAAIKSRLSTCRPSSIGGWSARWSPPSPELELDPAAASSSEPQRGQTGGLPVPCPVFGAHHATVLCPDRNHLSR